MATDVSGSRELIRSGYNGLLVPPGNIEALVQAIVYALKEPEMASELSRNAKQVLNTFTTPYVAQQYTKIYAESVEI